VRLDHLLSKEHLAILRDRPEPVSDVHADLVLMGGTLTSSAVASRRLPQYSLFGGGNGKADDTAAVGTLLGPEGAELSRPDRPSNGGPHTSVRGPYATVEAIGTARTLRTAQWTRASF
jgi:hypothetical protein